MKIENNCALELIYCIRSLPCKPALTRSVWELSCCVGWMLLPGYPGTCETSWRLHVEEKLVELEVVNRRPPRTCERWQKFCPSPLLLVVNKNALRTFFRLSRHILKGLVFSRSSCPPQCAGPSASPICSAEIWGFCSCCWKLCLHVWGRV